MLIKRYYRRNRDSVLISVLFSTGIAFLLGIMLLNPIWELYTPLFGIPKITPAVSAPVDGVFYILNAERGYRWEAQDPLSLWFHPLLPFLLGLAPRWFTLNVWFWIISLLFAAASIFLLYHLANVIFQAERMPTSLLPWCLLAPGGLGMATGNAEFPTLFFNVSLLLSVVWWRQSWITLTAASLAILTKPNGLYMIPILLVYALFAYFRKDREQWKQSLLGWLAIAGTWLAWILFVDWKADGFGTYFSLRLSFRQYVAGDAWTFFHHIPNSFLYWHDIRDQIRYSSALIIPLVNFLIIGSVPFKDEQHRYAMAAGNLAMLILTLYQGNPNKIIVYTTTLPGHFLVHLALMYQMVKQPTLRVSAVVKILRLGYVIYCLVMVVLYVLGTPLGWYF